MAALVEKTEAMSIAPKRDQERAFAESGARMEDTGLLGGPFTVAANSDRYDSRMAVFDRLWAAQEEKSNSLPKDKAIKITLSVVFALGAALDLSQTGNWRTSST